MSFSGACRGCVGSDWFGDRLLRNRAGLNQIAEAGWSRRCRVPIGCSKTGVTSRFDERSLGPSRTGGVCAARDDSVGRLNQVINAMAIAALTKNDRAAQGKFNWPLCYEAENFIFERIDAFLERSSFARVLTKRMRDETGTLLLDWNDHLLLSAADEIALREVGYVDDPLGETKDRYTALWHPQAILPRVF